MPRWTFYDPLIPVTYTFEISPNDGGTPSRKKGITYQNTAAPDGKTLIFQGRDDAMTMSFSGTLLSEAQLDAFNTWYDKQHQIRVTDDLSRQFWIFITEFDPKRAFSVSHPWKHTYQVTATILDWPA